MSDKRPSPGRSTNREKELPPMPAVKMPPPKSILFSSILDEDASVPIPVPVPVPLPALAQQPSEEGMESVPLSSSPSDFVSVADEMPSSSDNPSLLPSPEDVSKPGCFASETQPQRQLSSSTLSSYFPGASFFSAFSSLPASPAKNAQAAVASQTSAAESKQTPSGPPSQSFESSFSLSLDEPSQACSAREPAQPPRAPSTGPHVTTVNGPSAGGAHGQPGAGYTPVHPHWFFCRMAEEKSVWFPFSLFDSMNLEEACLSGDTDMDTLVPTDGGRYDVNVVLRSRNAVYWNEEPMPVRRATWFYREPLDVQFTPYDERFAAKLEEEYKRAAETGSWQRRLEFPSGEIIVMQGPTLIVHFPSAPVLSSSWSLMDSRDDVGGSQENVMRPCTVRRGVEDFDISDGEPQQIDHLVFMVHGIGAYCDLRFRGIVECVDDFRDLSLQMTQTHFKTSLDAGRVGRIELLPVAWHDALRGDCTGVDAQLKAITLRSIPKLRDLINDTLLDILFYTSPIYCQHIMDRVGSELNRMYNLFMKRNPNFRGHVSLAGHSLGSVILFDLLMRQPKPSSPTPEDDAVREVESDVPSKTPRNDLPSSMEDFLAELQLEEYEDLLKKEKIDLTSLSAVEEKDLKEIGMPLGPRKKLLLGYRQLEIRRRVASSAERDLERCTSDRRASTTSVSYSVGAAGTGQPFIIYPVLDFKPRVFFAMGSPIALFVTVRGLDNVNLGLKLPTCQSVFNIYHPFDPVAYRIESLIDPGLSDVRPVLIPHHKGRKRMHLELKEAMGRFGTEITRFADSIRTTWQTLYQYSPFRRFRKSEEVNESTVDNGVQNEIAKQLEDLPASPLGRDRGEDRPAVLSQLSSSSSYSASLSQMSVVTEKQRDFGQLNNGRRIDYVLQEKPIETVNEYLFALGAHLCYWESEDTMLLMLKELYAINGVDPDETSSAHPINNRALQSSEASEAPVSTGSHVQLPQSSVCSAGPSLSLTDALQRENPSHNHLEPAQPFVGINPADFSVAAPVNFPPPVVSVPSCPIYEDPGPPACGGPPPSAPPVFPPSDVATGKPNASVVRPRHYPAVPLPPQLGLTAAPGAPATVSGILPAPPYFRPTTAPPVMGMDPTAPPSENINIGPPPMAGFVPRHGHPGAKSGSNRASPASVPVPLAVSRPPSSASEPSSLTPSANPLQ